VAVNFSLADASLVLEFETTVFIDEAEGERIVAFRFSSVHNLNVTGNLRDFWLFDTGEQPSTSLVNLFDAQLGILSNSAVVGASSEECVDFHVEGMYGWHIRFVARDFQRSVRDLATRIND
jgi:hypothetical protein